MGELTVQKLQTNDLPFPRPPFYPESPLHHERPPTHSCILYRFLLFCAIGCDRWTVAGDKNLQIRWMAWGQGLHLLVYFWKTQLLEERYNIFHWAPRICTWSKICNFPPNKNSFNVFIFLMITTVHVYCKQSGEHRSL